MKFFIISNLNYKKCPRFCASSPSFLTFILNGVCSLREATYCSNPFEIFSNISEVNQNEKTISFTHHFLEDVSRHLFSYPFRFSNFSILVDISKELQRLPNLIKESLRDLVLRTVNFPTTHKADLVFSPKEVFVG